MKLPEIDYVCEKCGSHKVYAKPSGRGMGVYCAECNAWICRTTYERMLELYKEIQKDPNNLNDNISLRRIKRRNGVITMRCSKCDTLLFNSMYKGVNGQFDLVNAKYCPNCGRELI